jgi:cobalt-zinc-cadmium efflux system outer membrane protein
MLVLLLVPAPALAAAAGATPPADLGALLREADAGSPALRAAQARLEAARHVPSQAGARPDPEVGIAYLNDGVNSFTLGESEFSYLALTWTQEVKYPGKRNRMSEVALRDAERSEQDLRRTRLEIAAAVKAAYADLYQLDRTAGILDESRSNLESLAESSRRRYEVGQGIQESVLKAQTEILRLDVEIARVRQERRAAEVKLGAVLGRPADVAIGPVIALPDVALPGDAEALAEEAVAASPEVAGLAASVRRAEAGEQLARLDLKPDFVWSASYQDRGGLDPMVMGSFGVRLPVYRKTKQAQALLEKKSELLAARQELADAQLRARAAVRDLVSQMQRADRLLVLFGQGVIPQAQSALESAQSSYTVGRIGFLDVLNDLTVLFNARIDLATQAADRFRVVAALEPLLDRELIQIPGDAGSQGGDHAGDH